MQLLTITSDGFSEYGNALVSLYIDTFSEGKSFQYHSREDTENYLHSIFEVGYAILALDDNELIGAILLTPMTFDALAPDSIKQNFSLPHSVYVTEMMVRKTNQGSGIGKNLLNQFLETVDITNYTDAFIRVWIENTAALGLYKKMGFKECASIIQAKQLADKSGMFNFKKSYLHQKLS